MFNKLFLFFLFGLSVSAQDLAPDSLGDSIIFGFISSGSGIFARSGDYAVDLIAARNEYIIYAGVGTSTSDGTYTYRKTGANTAAIDLSDVTLGRFTLNITFFEAGRANYSVDSSSGTQSGSFSFYEMSLLGVTPSTPTTSSGDWLYDKNYPWVYSTSKGWLFYQPTDQGLWIYRLDTGSWALKN